MKKLLLFISVLLVSSGLFAQTKASRLVAKSIYKYNGVFKPSDSSVYMYTGDRGADVKKGPTQYDTLMAYTYNSGGGTWNNNSKSTKFYDAQNNCPLSRIYLWDAPNSKWKGYKSYHSQFYNGPTKVQESMLTDQNWDNVNSVWLNNTKYTHFFSGDDTKDTTVYQTWDVPGTYWKNNTFSLFSYDVSNNLLSRVDYNWDIATSTWKLFRRYNYTYNGNLVATAIQQTYNSGTSTWGNDTRSTYTYDANNNQTGNVFAIWDNATSSWKSNFQYLYTFSAANDMQSQIRQDWDNATNSWKNISRTEYTYDANHNILSQIEETWVQASSIWKNTNRTQDTYNSYNQILTEQYDQWNVGGFWEFTNTSTIAYYYYEEFTLGVADRQSVFEGDMKLYPNPVANMLQVNVNFDSPAPFVVQVSDVTGKVFKTYHEEATSHYARSIITADLPNGNYFLTIKSGNSSKSEQFAVQQ